MGSGVQHKMLFYEVAPPTGVWKKIAEELDESELDHVFPSTLYQAEVAAPAAAWGRIQNSLHAGHEAAIPERRMYSPLTRYAAAAVIIGLIAWGGLQLLSNKKRNKEMAAIEIAHPEKVNSGTSVAPISEMISEKGQPGINADITDEERNDAALEASKKTFARLDMPVNPKRLKNIAAAYHFASSDRVEEPEESSAKTSSRYIVLMTPDGHFIRMSKKLDNMVCCVSGEEQDKDCKDQMTQWREKMACSPTGHSTGSFLDILSLIKSLEEH